MSEEPKFIDAKAVPQLCKGKVLELLSNIPVGKALVLEKQKESRLGSLRCSLSLYHKRGLFTDISLRSKKSNEGYCTIYLVHDANAPKKAKT